MKLFGWEEPKTMQFYIRLAGVEIQGITDSLSIFDGPRLISVAESSERTADSAAPSPVKVCRTLVSVTRSHSRLTRTRHTFS